MEERVFALKDLIEDRKGFEERGTPESKLVGYKSKILWDDKVVALIAEIGPGMQKWGHVHPHADSVVVILEGEGEYILDKENTRSVKAGDVCFARAGQIHGVHNSGSQTIRYLCVEGPGPLIVEKA
jgi:mannose-6-phosphate isomerase-like protein (cupin superfamily)